MLRQYKYTFYYHLRGSPLPYPFTFSIINLAHERSSVENKFARICLRVCYCSVATILFLCYFTHTYLCICIFISFSLSLSVFTFLFFCSVRNMARRRYKTTKNNQTVLSVTKMVYGGVTYLIKMRI